MYASRDIRVACYSQLSKYRNGWHVIKKVGFSMAFLDFQLSTTLSDGLKEKKPATYSNNNMKWVKNPV